MRKRVLTALLFLLSSSIYGQQNSILINTFFKDRLFENTTERNTYIGSSFLPVFESEYDLNNSIRDSSKQYYNFSEILFKKHLLEAKGSNYYITISPIVDFTLGKDLSDTSNRRLFQNTRGIFVEGDLFKNFSFSTSVFENQGRYANYQSSYFSSVGELYPNQIAGSYLTQNAVIPGGARTKAFKTDGFDYAYATGNIIYKPHRSILLSAGNTSQFIGDGYRSLLLSDNSVPAPFFRGTFHLSKKWQFNYLRMRLINLIRRPVSTSVEAYYETKGLSCNYISFTPNKKMSFSLFEGVIWSKGDSITSKKVHPLFYNPVPFISEFALSNNTIYSLIGLNFSILPFNSHRIYGQAAIGNLSDKQTAFQIGYRGYNLLGLKNLFVQLEYNNVSSEMYRSPNTRLNYSQYNLPLASPKGTAYQEFILRSTFERNRVYADVKTIVYLLKNYSSTALLPINTATLYQNGTAFLEQIEMGYRFNKKMNLCVFGNWQFRSSNTSTKGLTNQFSIGLRTGINNHYTDF